MLIRPILENIIRDIRGCCICNCKTELRTYASIHDHWQMGHFDYEYESQDENPGNENPGTSI